MPETFDDSNGSKRRRIALRLCTFYVAYFTVIGIQLPFWPVWLASRGLGPGEIGVILALGTAARVLASPTFAQIADRLGERRRPLIALSTATVAVFCLFGASTTFWTILAVTILHAAVWGPVLPLAEILVATTSREHGLEYGRLRLWGSLTFIAVAALAGRALVDRSADLVFWSLLAALAACLAACLVLPDGRVTPAPVAGAGLRHFARDRPFVLFLLASGLIQGSHGFYYAFGTLHWKAVGYSEAVIGGLWAEGVIAEVVLFAFAAAVVRRLPPATLILIGGLAGVLRWMATGLSDALPVLLVVQVLHALTFGAVHLGAVNYILQRVPPSLSATAMSLYASVTMGLATGLTMLASGPLYQAAGGLAYLGMAGLAALGAAFAVILMRTLGERPA